MPIEHVTRTTAEAVWIGATMPARSSSTSRCKSVSSDISTTTTNSSPPNRARVPPAGTSCGDTASDLDQDSVAHVVTEAVVDELEPVEVDEEHGNARPRLAAAARSASLSRSTSNARLASPVNGSWSA